MTRRASDRVIVVLDNEAVTLLTPRRRHDPARRQLMARIESADRALVPTVVRVEANVARNATHADVNRLTDDVDVDTAVANDAVSLRPSSAVSPVDACVAAVAVAAGGHGVLVEVLTSNPGDLRSMLDPGTHVRRI